MSELKSCPFCGEESLSSYNTKFGFQPHCSNDDCFMSSIIIHDFFTSEEEAIAAWNKRVGDEK